MHYDRICALYDALHRLVQNWVTFRYKIIHNREQILRKGRNPLEQNCAQNRFISQKILVPCQQESSCLESLEGHWRPSLCIEIQYAEEVGVVLL